MSRRERPPERIPVVLATLRDVWEHFPQLRLGQLIEAAVGTEGASVFYVEEDELVQRLLNFAQAHKDQP